MVTYKSGASSSNQRHQCNSSQVTPQAPLDAQNGLDEYEAQMEVEAIRRWRTELEALESRAFRAWQHWDLSGDGPDPLATLCTALLLEARDMRALRRHRHEYDDDDYCVVCGRDGRV